MCYLIIDSGVIEYVELKNITSTVRKQFMQKITIKSKWKI